MRRRPKAVTGIGLVLVLAGVLAFCNGCAGCRQTVSHMKSSVVGLKRRITLYANNGDVIKQWEGRYMVETEGGAARFIHDGKAIYIAGTFTIEQL